MTRVHVDVPKVQFAFAVFACTPAIYHERGVGGGGWSLSHNEHFLPLFLYINKYTHGYVAIQKQKWVIKVADRKELRVITGMRAFFCFYFFISFFFFAHTTIIQFSLTFVYIRCKLANYYRTPLLLFPVFYSVSVLFHFFVCFVYSRRFHFVNDKLSR